MKSGHLSGATVDVYEKEPYTVSKKNKNMLNDFTYGLYVN